MKKLVSLLCIMIFYALIMTVDATECDLILSENIKLIETSLSDNNIIIDEQGKFIHPRTKKFVDGNTIFSEFRENGSQILFETEDAYKVFLEFLHDISQGPCSYSNKSYAYIRNNISYSLILNKYDIDSIIILINIEKCDGKSEDEDEWCPETTYIYNFVKRNGTTVLIEINAAG